MYGSDGGHPHSDKPSLTFAPAPAARPDHAPLLPKVQMQDEIDFVKMFPSMFTFSCLLVFLPPIMMTVQLGNDLNVVRWIGPWCQFAVLIPFLFFFGHLIHIKMRHPYKPVVLGCLFIPCAVLLGLNDAVSTVASQKADQLLSRDCRNDNAKLHLEQSWLTAYKLYAICVAEAFGTGPNRNATTSSGLPLSTFRLQDCSQYTAEFKASEEDWNYLRQLEDLYSCSGWCNYEPSLWTSSRTTDSCSRAVGQAFKAKVVRLSNQAMLYTVAVLVASSVMFIRIGPALHKRGVMW